MIVPLAIRRAFVYYTVHTELLAFFTVFYFIIIGLLLFASAQTFIVALGISLVTVFIAAAIVYGTILYLHKVRYGARKSKAVRFHNFFNKSFKIRSLFRDFTLRPKIKFGSLRLLKKRIKFAV